jgi:hypothetical protein
MASGWLKMARRSEEAGRSKHGYARNHSETHVVA